MHQHLGGTGEDTQKVCFWVSWPQSNGHLIMTTFKNNSEIWHLPTLKSELKQKLISISGRAIKSCMYYPDEMISFKNIHKMNNRAMPVAIMQYRLAIQLFKIYNSNDYTHDWVLLQNNHIFTTRQTTFMAFKSNNTKVGINILANRLPILNGKIPFNWLNESLMTFKMKCKKLLLTY